jgi:hypothetical protein
VFTAQSLARPTSVAEPTFGELVREYDPHGKFSNELVVKYLVTY